MRGLPLVAQLSRIASVVPLLGALLCAAGSGCGPIEYIANVPLDAAGALSEARQVEGARYAPYELTAAEEYIHKSRQLAGYARFHSAVAFGRKAADNARKAKQIALEKAQLPEERGDAPAAGGEPSATEVKTVERPATRPAARPEVRPAPAAVRPAERPADQPTKVIIVPASPAK
jgi:hypothetical protein